MAKTFGFRTPTSVSIVVVFASTPAKRFSTPVTLGMPTSPIAYAPPTVAKTRSTTPAMARRLPAPPITSDPPTWAFVPSFLVTTLWLIDEVGAR
ncbi:MAG TPA: hypothetical protein VKA37_07725 [Halobacteriales archaeon]|nr:hypothetical protein [Halobacteriales archaeon]